MSELEAWMAAARAALDLGEAKAADASNEQRLVLDVARDVAHGVVRPAAPLGAYLLGLAVGGGADLAQAAGKLASLAREWPAN
jgi:hypothetical protein